MCCTDSGPVGDMTFSRNVYWNSTGYCGKGWPATDAHFVAPPHSPTGLGDNFISGNYALDNGIVQNEMGVGYGGVLANATGTCCKRTDITGSSAGLRYRCAQTTRWRWTIPPVRKAATTTRTAIGRGTAATTT